jgi:hypothetical protein
VRPVALRGGMLAAVILTLLVVPAWPTYADCQSDATLGSAQAGCHTDSTGLQSLYASADSDGYRYRIRLWCASRVSPEQCAGSATPCADPPGSFRYDILRASLGQGSSWVVIGQACLGAGDLASLGAITPELVQQAFQRLTWPRADLSVQPPGGETLVNLETNFFTTNTEPSTQTVTLLGTGITIEATPSSYVWHFGQGAEPRRTTSPGAPFPDLEVTHVYQDAQTTVNPSVDVTYSGRYRIGDSAWIDIPSTLTVNGAPIELTVIEGQPNLVG